MSGDKVKPDGVRAAIQQILDKYSWDASQALERAVNTTGKLGLSAIKTFGGYGGSRYRKSFAVKFENFYGVYTATIYSRRYWLAHLLEHGYRTRNGSMSRAFPHWEPTERLVEKEFEGVLLAELEKIKVGD
jgi:hypothetical protein